MASTAQFVSTPKNFHTRISGAAAVNTARDGSGTEGTNLFVMGTFGANGGRIDNISIKAAGTVAATTAGMIRFFLKDQAGNKRLIREQSVSSVTPTASVAGFSVELTGLNWVFAPNASLLVSSQVADSAGNQFDITVMFAGEF